MIVDGVKLRRSGVQGLEIGVLAVRWPDGHGHCCHHRYILDEDGTETWSLAQTKRGLCLSVGEVWLWMMIMNDFGNVKKNNDLEELIKSIISKAILGNSEVSGQFINMGNSVV